MNIRHASSKDLELLNAVVRQAVMTWQLPERVKRLSLPSLQYDELDLKYFIVVVAEVETGIIGVAALDPMPRDIEDKANALMLHGIYVDPVHQRKGVGRSLFTAIEEVAADKGAGALLIKAQKGTEDFYLSLGLKKLPVKNAGTDFDNRYCKDLGR